jgi:hypothetical protein
MSPVICKQENLALTVFPQSFDPDRICVYARQTEMGRAAGFEDRQFDDAPCSGNTLQLRPVDVMAAVVVVPV